MLEHYGRKRGFEDGWRDKVAGNPARPQPDLGAALLSPGYINAYRAGYADGYAEAERDQRRDDNQNHIRTQILVRRNSDRNRLSTFER